MATNTKNFKVQEFACHCGCKHNPIDQRVINMAQVIRDALGVPVRVTSGCRCEENNARNKGVPNSYHIYGKAADLTCSLGAVKMFETVKKLKAAGKLPDLEYCILYKRKNIIHIDCGGRRKTFWEVRP